jgi:tetratricopeptide (TPR) repeat protein
MLGRPLLIAQLDAMHRSRSGDWYYRTFAPGLAMAELPDAYVVNVDQSHRRLAQIVIGADVLIINGVCSADLLPVIAERKRARRPTVFEINDDVQAVQASNALAAFFSQPENLRLFRRLALTCDAVQYSVEELERLYGALNPRGRVFHNQLVAPPALRAPSGRSVKLGWGGSAGHFEDMAAVAPTLIDFVRAHAEVTLWLMCSERIWRLFDALPADRKHLTPVGSIDDYYAFVAQLDIGIAPNRDAGFNRARSDVKFLEYAGYGAVAVVQRLTPYLASVKDGENGFLFGTHDELRQVLTRLVQDPALRENVRQNAYRYAATERLQPNHANARVAFYRELIDPATDSKAAQLFAELSALEGAEVTGRHCMLAHTRFETLLHDGAILLQQASSQKRGEELLREAARLEPAHALPELFLGVASSGEADLRAALQKNPRSVQALLALGSAQLKQSQFRPALEQFLAAAELAPGYEMPFAHAAQAVAQLGAAKEAAEFERIAQTFAQAVAPTTAS